MQKIRPILKKSNKHKYAQVLIENEVILTTRSDSSSKYCQNNYKNEVHNLSRLSKNSEEFKKLIILYNDKKISYRTLKFLIDKFSKIESYTDLYLNLITEFSMESGFIKNTKKFSFFK